MRDSVKKGMECSECGSTNTKLLTQNEGSWFTVKLCYDCKNHFEYIGKSDKWVKLK